MRKCVSYDKLSKKEKKHINAKTRRTFNDFGCFSPVTKIIPDKKKKTVENVAESKSSSLVRLLNSSPL